MQLKTQLLRGCFDRRRAKRSKASVDRFVGSAEDTDPFDL